MIQKESSEPKLEIEVNASSVVQESAATGAPEQIARSDWPRIQAAPMTLFAIPKPFQGEADRPQRNAINSWLQLRPAVEVVLLGDDVGTAELAAELAVAHISGVKKNSLGTPLLGSAFSLVSQFSASPILIYCNCDVILMDDFVSAIEQLVNSEKLDQFLAIGRRTDLQVDQALDFGSASDVEQFLADGKRNGEKSPIVCKEFFAFTRDVFPEIPEFAVGRGNWDNWIVAEAKRNGVPVVDIAPVANVFHQKHGYKSMNTNRRSRYVTGEEARENERLGGGKNLISGASASWVLTENGPVKKRFPGLNAGFWLDLPRFLRLLAHLMAR